MKIIAIVSVAFLCVAASSAAVTWPTVMQMEKTIYVDPIQFADVTIDIIGSDTKSLYQIQCHSSEYERGEFDYSGDFECRLISLYSQEKYSTLFTDVPDQTRDWESRARFFVEELVGPCADYPDFGRTRVFRLRGMTIVLEIDDVKTNGVKPELSSLSLTVKVTADKSATSPIAEPSKFAEPPLLHPNINMQRDCKKVVRTVEG